MNTLWIILACGVACAYAHPTCDQAALKRCEDMKPFDDDDDNMFPTDLATLQNECSRAYPGINCFLDVFEACPGLVNQRSKDYFIGSKDLLDKVCVAGDLQRIVLRNAKCLNELVKNKQPVCEARAVEKYALHSCEYFRSIQSCMEDFIRDNCGDSAVEIFLEVSRVIDPMIEDGACDKQ